MKKVFALLLILVAPLSLVSCINSVKKEANEDRIELIVFAAASMTETLNNIKTIYENENKNVNIVYNFDSSGTLKTQIENGAECDIFISAAPKQMNELENINLIDKNERKDLLKNKIALVVPDGNKNNILSFDDLINKLNNGSIILAIGNKDVPVGQYTKKIFTYFNVDEEDLVNKGVLTYGSNVKEVTTQVKENLVDAGIVYSTDAYSAKLTIVDTATKEMCGEVIYPIAVINNSKRKEEAKKYIEYLQNEKSKNIFREVGFSPID